MHQLRAGAFALFFHLTKFEIMNYFDFDYSLAQQYLLFFCFSEFIQTIQTWECSSKNDFKPYRKYTISSDSIVESIRCERGVIATTGEVLSQRVCLRGGGDRHLGFSVDTNDWRIRRLFQARNRLSTIILTQANCEHCRQIKKNDRARKTDPAMDSKLLVSRLPASRSYISENFNPPHRLTHPAEEPTMWAKHATMNTTACGVRRQIRSRQP